MITDPANPTAAWQQEADNIKIDLNALMEDKSPSERFRDPRLADIEPNDVDNMFATADDLMATLLCGVKTLLLTEEEAVRHLTAYAENTKRYLAFRNCH